MVIVFKLDLPGVAEKGWAHTARCPLHKPARVHDVVLRQFIQQLLLLTGQRFDFFGRRTGVKVTRFANGVFQYNRARPNDHVFLYHSVIHYNGTHAYQGMIFKVATVHDSVMPDRYMITDGSSGPHVSCMYYRAILYIGIVADMDIVNIPTDNGVKPNRAIIAQYNIANYGAVICYKAVLSP
jgi:hypothetical protein